MMQKIKIDIQDIFFFCGLAMLVIGIYLKWGVWASGIVGGLVLMAIGYSLINPPPQSPQ